MGSINYRLFLIPGMGHCSGIGSADGVAGPPNTLDTVPLPASGQLFSALVSWVENGDAPSSLVLQSVDGSASGLLCPYPAKPTWGAGPINDAASYTCD